MTEEELRARNAELEAENRMLNDGIEAATAAILANAEQIRQNQPRIEDLKRRAARKPTHAANQTRHEAKLNLARRAQAMRRRTPRPTVAAIAIAIDRSERYTADLLKLPIE